MDNVNSSRRLGPILRRVVILLGLLAVTSIASIQGGKMFAMWKAEAARQEHWENTNQAMEDQRSYVHADSLFPSFALSNRDGSLTTLHDEIPAGGLMVYVSPDCPNCERALGIIDRSLGTADHYKRVILVAPQDDVYAFDWVDSLGVEIPVFLDASGFIETGYDFVVIPFIVLLDQDHKVVDHSTGAWSEEDYVRMLRM